MACFSVCTVVVHGGVQIGYVLGFKSHQSSPLLSETHLLELGLSYSGVSETLICAY